MDWIQFSIFIIGNMVFTLTLWLWNRSESRTDNRRMLDLIEAIKDEMVREFKDFHGRLCAIEEKNSQLIQRFLEKNSIFENKSK